MFTAASLLKSNAYTKATKTKQIKWLKIKL